MRLRYGGYLHDDNEVRVDRIDCQRQFNRRSQAIDQTFRWTISGELHASTQAEITAKILLLQAAYNSDFNDLVLIDNSGNIAQALLNTGSSTGVKVIQPPSFSSPTPGEYSTYRTYSITLEATYPFPVSEVLVDFTEQVSIVGDGGPRFAVIELQEGLPERQIIRQRTLVRATQSGRAIGKFSRPIPPGPIWPQWVDRPETNVTLVSPEPMGLTYENYAVSWSYSFTSPVPLAAEPNLWS